MLDECTCPCCHAPSVNSYPPLQAITDAPPLTVNANRDMVPTSTEHHPMKFYVAGPMRGIPEFNFPAFNAAAAKLRADGHFVFNPAEKDNERHGVDISKGNATGCEHEAAKTHGFDLRVALGDDLAFICREAEAIAMLPGWEKSKGAIAEHATAVALGLQVVVL